jgi:hypothetical protein
VQGLGRSAFYGAESTYMGSPRAASIAVRTFRQIVDIATSQNLLADPRVVAILFKEWEEIIGRIQHSFNFRMVYARKVPTQVVQPWIPSLNL